MLRVLVAEDSAVARMLLVRILDQDDDLEIVGQVADGAEAVGAVERLLPDVIVMDIRMPAMDGLAATRAIMRRRATPIVLVTAASVHSDIELSFRALEAGALAVLAKPSGPGSDRFVAQAAELVRTVKLMAEVRMVGRRIHRRDRQRDGCDVARVKNLDVNLVAIGASTGGPAALAAILAALPGDLPVPVLVVQHISAGFDDPLVTWLASGSKLSVRLARHAQLLRPGEVVVGPHDSHLGISADGRATVLSDAPPIRGHRPSASYLFRSAARARSLRTLGVVLTGMGDDGADGLAEVKRAGGMVVAQDEATSVVYGMPGRVVELGLADAVIPVDKIAETIASATGRRTRATI